MLGTSVCGEESVQWAVLRSIPRRTCLLLAMEKERRALLSVFAQTVVQGRGSGKFTDEGSECDEAARKLYRLRRPLSAHAARKFEEAWEAYSRARGPEIDSAVECECRVSAISSDASQ